MDTSYIRGTAGMADLPWLVLQIIMDKLDHRHAIRLMRINSQFYRMLYVHSISASSTRIRLTNAVLTQEKFRYLRTLDLRDNTYVVDINHLVGLETLYVSHDSQLTVAGFQDCRNIEKLVCGSRLITSINHLHKLKILDISSSYCVITNAGISNCTSIERLDLGDNKNITDINHLVNLKELYMVYNPALRVEGFINCRSIEILKTRINYHITSVNHLPRLKIFHAGCRIGNAGIKDCPLIEELYASDSPSITDLGHLKNLKILYAAKDSGISNESIKNCLLLTELDIEKNKGTWNDLNQFVHLRKLNAIDTKLTNKGIEKCLLLTDLKASRGHGLSARKHAALLRSVASKQRREEEMKMLRNRWKQESLSVQGGFTKHAEMREQKQQKQRDKKPDKGEPRKRRGRMPRPTELGENADDQQNQLDDQVVIPDQPLMEVETDEQVAVDEQVEQVEQVVTLRERQKQARAAMRAAMRTEIKELNKRERLIRQAESQERKKQEQLAKQAAGEKARARSRPRKRYW